jgi:hypothetical protein
MKTINERDVVKAMKLRVKEFGGEMRKVRWEGRKNAPDWLIMMPGDEDFGGLSFFAEFKKPGEEPTPAQLREINRMRNCGLRVLVISTLKQVEEIVL